MIDAGRVKAALVEIRNFLRRRPVRILVSLFAILFAIAVLGLLLYRERDALLNYPWRIHPVPLVASVGVYLAALTLVVWVWAMIMRSLGSKAGFWQHFRSFSIANIAKRLPGTIWYVAWRADMYQQGGTSVKTTTLASGVEIAVSILGGVLASIVFAIPILARYPAGIAAIVLLFAICAFLLAPHNLSQVLKLLGSDIAFFSYRSILAWIAIYLFVWLSGGIILFLVANILYPLGLESLSYVIGCWSLVGILSYLLYFLPTNMGFNEIGFSLLLTAIMPSSFAVIVAVLSRALLLLYEIIVAAVCWGFEFRIKRG